MRPRPPPSSEHRLHPSGYVLASLTLQHRTLQQGSRNCFSALSKGKLEMVKFLRVNTVEIVSGPIQLMRGGT